ncbi:MAG: phosphoglycolate phosphatase [Spongiibacteraceae bacterium]
MSLHRLLGREVRGLLFDLDGTLLDSAPDLAQAIDRMLVELGLAPAGEARVRQWVGNGSRQLVERALVFANDGKAPGVDDTDAAQAIFFAHYRACMTERSRLYDGVRAALDHWHRAGIAMACVTNKPARFTDPLLDFYELRALLPVAISGDSLAVRKPDPAPLLEACRQLQVDPAATVMIGDSRNDVLAARGAGMPVVCVRYGYNHGRPIADEGADLLINSLLELLHEPH